MVTHTLNQIEKNVGISFGYVKKDLLSVNDMVSDLYEKIQHLSLNQAMLVEKIMKLEQASNRKSATVQKVPAKKKDKTKKTAKKIVKKETITYK